MKPEQLAHIFNTWADEYAKNPDQFGSILNARGEVEKDYGINAASHFLKMAEKLGYNVGCTASKDWSAMI